MVDENNALFNNFVETVERYELLSQTEKLIFCFSGGKDASIGLHFLKQYLDINREKTELHVIMVLFPKHVYFSENNEHVQLDNVVKYWENLGIYMDVLQVSREDISSITLNPCKSCKNARKELIDEYLSVNGYIDASSTLITGYTLYDAIAYTSEICLRSNFFNSYADDNNRIANCLHKIKPLEILPNGMRLIRPLIRMDERLIKKFLEEKHIPYISQSCMASVRKHKRLYFEALKSLNEGVNISYEGLITFLNKNNVFLPKTFDDINMLYGFTDC